MHAPAKTSNHQIAKPGNTLKAPPNVTNAWKEMPATRSASASATPRGKYSRLGDDGAHHRHLCERRHRGSRALLYLRSMPDAAAFLPHFAQNSAPTCSTFEGEHGLRVNAVDFECLIFGQVRGEALAVDEQPFGAPELQRALAMLQAFPASGLVGPRPRAIDIRRPKQVPASASSSLDRIGPQRHDDLSVCLAHAAPARARILEEHAAGLESLDARDQAASPSSWAPACAAHGRGLSEHPAGPPGRAPRRTARSAARRCRAAA